MIIGPQKLLSDEKTKNAVEHLCERELTNPEGAGFDLRLGAVFVLDKNSGGFIDGEQRATPKFIKLAEYKEGEKAFFLFEKDKYYIVSTIEFINVPPDMQAHFYPRSTLVRCGVFLNVGYGNPGNSFQPVFGLINLGDSDFQLELGARFMKVFFHQVDGATLYRGQWQGGRIATDAEKQV